MVKKLNYPEFSKLQKYLNENYFTYRVSNYDNNTLRVTILSSDVENEHLKVLSTKFDMDLRDDKLCGFFLN